MDRNFKLRQMFSDYLEMKAKESTTLPIDALNFSISGMSEDAKKKATILKITEEEGELFDIPDKHCPIYFCDDLYELKWIKDKLSNPPTLTIASEEEHVKLAARLLQLFIKTEMLESNLYKYDDIRMIRVFFMDEREKPTEKLVVILDNVLTMAMSKLLAFSDKITVAVDYEIRAFIADSARAKRLVLETMLKYPEYVPDSWGGEAAMAHWKEAKEADIRRRDADERDREKAEETERKEKEEKAKKDERIKKEVEEAERKKKEEKEKRKKEKEVVKEKEKPPAVVVVVEKEAVTLTKKKEKVPSLKEVKKVDVKNSDNRGVAKKVEKKKTANEMKSREPSADPTPIIPSPTPSASPAASTTAATPAAMPGQKKSTTQLGAAPKRGLLSREGGPPVIGKVIRSVSRMTRKKDKE